MLLVDEEAGCCGLMYLFSFTLKETSSVFSEFDVSNSTGAVQLLPVVFCSWVKIR